MKSTNKRKALAASLVVATMAFGFAMAGCSSEPQSLASTNDITYAEGQPPLMPANDHQGRWESLGMKGCVGCHGYNSDGNPTNAYATQIPDDHYVNNDHNGQLSTEREQCIQCHPIDDPSTR